MIEQKYFATRVSRLESHLLDHELEGTIDSLVDGLEIPIYSEELKTVLRLYLFTKHVNTRASAGMQVYNLNYCDTSTLHREERSFEIPPKYKLILLTAINLTGSYLIKRSNKLEKLLQGSIVGGLRLPWLNLDNATLLFKSLNVLNFLAFLKNGMYLTIPERVLGLVPVVSKDGHYNNTQLNMLQMDFMYREVIWKAFAEFLTTLIPLINVERVKNRILRIIGMVPKLDSKMKLSEKIQRESNATRCAICLKQPFNPYIIGCRHVFCYYCLQANHLKDPSTGYVCMLCKYSTKDSSSVQRYKSLNNTNKD